MKSTHKVELTICPDSLTKQKQILLLMLNHFSNEWDDEMLETMDGLLNMLDYIQDSIEDRLPV
jgi:hypothetical protein